MIEKKSSQTLDDKLNTVERARNNFAWHKNPEGGVRGLLFSAEKVKELVEKKYRKNYWKIGALVGGGIAALATSLLMFVYTNESINKRDGWFEIEKPFEEVDKKIEKYKGSIVEGLTLREVRENIHSSLELFCERGYVGNGEGLFCDTGITPPLYNLLDVSGIIDKENPNSSSVVLTFDERVIKYDESIQGKTVTVNNKGNYTLTDFSQDVLDREHRFVRWIGREYGIEIDYYEDYEKLKDLALVMVFPPLTPIIDKNALPKTKFRLIYNDDSKKDIVLDKRVGSCLTTEEMKPYCGDVDIKECEEDYWKSFSALEEMACRLQKKIPRDLNKHGDTGYELELVKWTTEKREHVLKGKATLSKEERVSAIHHLVDLFRTYIYNNILNLDDDSRMYNIKMSTNDPEIVAMMYELAHSYLDGKDVSEEDKKKVSIIFEHIADVSHQVKSAAIVKNDVRFCSRLRNQNNIEELLTFTLNIVKCLKGESSYEEEVINEVYKALRLYAESPALKVISELLAERACYPNKEQQLEIVHGIARVLTFEDVIKKIDECKDSSDINKVMEKVKYMDPFHLTR